LGKTEWARSLGPHAYIANQWNLDSFDGLEQEWWGRGYIIFDDLEWDTFKHSAKSFCGGQSDFSVTDKYRRKRKLVGGVPSIILLNPNEFKYDGWMDFALTDWGKQNIQIIELRNKLYCNIEVLITN